MTILWCGGEDVDFPLGTPPSINTTGGSYASGYGRCSLYVAAGLGTSARSNSFPGGSVTSFWAHVNAFPSGSASIQGTPFFGLGLNSASKMALFVGADATTYNKLALWTWNGSAAVQLAAEAGTSLGGGILAPMDIQIINYGATATVNVYYNQNLVITFTGNIAVSGVAALDCFCVPGTNGFFANSYFSEAIVADADTRAMRLVTLAPNAAGDTNNWTGAYTQVNEVTISDATPVFVNTTGQDFQANLIDLPSGNFTVNAVKIAARAEVTAGATPTGLKLGVKTGGTINVGGAQTLSASFATYERLMTTNPVTATAWAQADINPLQIDLQSA